MYDPQIYELQNAIGSIRNHLDKLESEMSDRLEALEDRLSPPNKKAADVTSDISNLMTPNQLSEILQRCMEMILRLMTNAKSCDSKEIEVLFKRISKALDYLRSC